VSVSLPTLCIKLRSATGFRLGVDLRLGSVMRKRTGADQFPPFAIALARSYIIHGDRITSGLLSPTSESL
jgi:hypothetical protein